ncbi:MAG: hypothetical protein ICV60_06870 [Pyrinomonadaceae bacterium]|nr:hypothetical protein [Pyrinomonadaceae bacterium]
MSTGSGHWSTSRGFSDLQLLSDFYSSSDDETTALISPQASLIITNPNLLNFQSSNNRARKPGNSLAQLSSESRMI